MEKRGLATDAERIQLPYENFVRALEAVLKHPTKKRAQVNQKTFFRCSLGDAKILWRSPINNIQYDTKENRFCRRLAVSACRHLNDLLREYAWEKTAAEMLSQMCAAVEQILLHPVFECLSEEQEEKVEVSALEEDYRKLYHSYKILKYALCELEAEVESGLSAVNFEERDVLVGSFGSEKQWKHNLAKKYYYAPEKHFDPTCFPIRYIALYQSSHFSEKGICYYGAVTKIRRLQRKKIWFSTRRKNGEEWYLLFRVKHWQRLSRPIEIQDEGVFAPKYTNLFLLGHAEKSYELFHIRSAQEYRVFRQIKRILTNVAHSSEAKEAYPIEGGKSIRLCDGFFELLDERGMPMRTISVLDFSQHPTVYLDDIFACVAKVPEESNAPLWLKRENEAYFERYGKPYSDD